MRGVFDRPNDSEVLQPSTTALRVLEWLRAADSDPSVAWHSSGQMARALICERARASRTGESFSLLVFHWLEADTLHTGVQALRALLNQRLRTTDQVGWLGDGSVGVVLPFAGARGARSLVESLLASYPAMLPPLACDIYSSESTDPRQKVDREWNSFPRDGEDHRGGGMSPPSNWRDAHVRSASLYTTGSTSRVSLQSSTVLFVRSRGRWKRGLDIVGALIGLVLSAPIIPLAMLLIRIVSPGPALFRQKRAGRGGVPFTLYKLRTMRPDAEALKPTLLAANEQDGPAFKMTRDPRVIPVLGRVLRSSSIDELPQFWNVLIGDMSLVGPRPLPLAETEQCEFWQRQRLDVTPGLTGLWQVHGRARTSFAEWIRMDLRYIQQRSLLRDLALVVKTIPAVLGRKGAR